MRFSREVCYADGKCRADTLSVEGERKMAHSHTIDSQTEQIELAVYPTSLLDVADMGREALAQAVTHCAQKMQLDRQAVIECLRRGDALACDYFHYSLAHQVGECLGELDVGAKAVYLYIYDATPMDAYLSEEAHTPLMHLVVWAQRKTAALDAVVDALDQAVAKDYASLAGVPRLPRVLDIQVVDDAEVSGRIGYGALLTSIHEPPLQVWKR
jgi:hypothetical protein